MPEKKELNECLIDIFLYITSFSTKRSLLNYITVVEN